VWLIESDATRRGSSASRLPLPVILAHVTFALTGLGVWVIYLLLDRPALAWADVGVLGVIVTLGTAMFARWIPVYRSPGAEVAALAAAQPVPGAPPEGNFPLVVVVAHGLFATSTVVLVLLTALGVGGS
jgi:hypothetical protein